MYQFNIFASFSLFCALTYFILGCYILYINSKSFANQLFFAACTGMAIWGLGEGMQRAAIDLKVAMVWATYVTGFGAAMHSSTLLHFWLEFSDIARKIKHKFIILFLIYFPLVFFTILRFFYTDHMITTLKHSYWGYYIVSTKLYEFYQIFIIANIVIVSLLAFKKYLVTVGKFKKQYLYIALGVFIPVTVGSISQAILPIFFHIYIPEISVSSAFLFIFTIAYSIKKYGLFTIDVKTVAKNVINTINDFVVAVDKDLEISFVNQEVLSISGLSESDLIHHPIQTILKDDFFKQSYDEILQRVPLNNFRLEFISKNKNILIPVSTNVSLLKSDSGDVIGLVFVARDIQQIDQLVHDLQEKNNELEAFNKIATNRELKMIELKKIVDKQNEELIKRGGAPIS